LLVIRFPVTVYMRPQTYRILERLSADYGLEKKEIIERAIRVLNRRGQDMLTRELPRNY